MSSDSGEQKPHVLFVCTRFGGRALFAQAMAEKEAGDRIDFTAAGFECAEVGARVSKCGAEIGLDIEPRPDGIPTVFERKKAGEHFDRIVMMCDPEGNESCELFEKHIKVLFGDRVDNRLWAVGDMARLPREESAWMESARLIRDNIGLLVHDLLAEV